MACVFLIFVFVLYLFECCISLELVKGWEYLNLNCRDDSNDPVDWWYIYKPPSNLGPSFESGTNFTYITSDMAGKLMPSSSHILSDSMLQYTLAPMYNGDYTDFMAVAVYEGREPKDDFKGSSSLGIMMANAMGGMWIGHTIPGFPNLTLDAAAFPPEELKNGHMIMCFSLGIETLNSLAIAIKQTGPAVTKIVVPQLLKSHLPEWTNLMTTDHPLRRRSKTSVRRTKILSFATREKSLRGIIMARSPGDTRCVYQSFAKTKGIVVDVYGHKEHHGLEECDRKYSIRNINSISLKFREQVYYIPNSSDTVGFALSTGASWQRAGVSKNQYWMCTGNIENQPFGAKGGVIACVFHFQIWRSFDKLKIKEPECPKTIF